MSSFSQSEALEDQWSEISEQTFSQTPEQSALVTRAGSGGGLTSVTPALTADTGCGERGGHYSLVTSHHGAPYTHTCHNQENIDYSIK